MNKVCNKCNIEKEETLENFYKCNTVKSGFRSICKECDAKYRKDNKENHDKWVKNNSDWNKNWKKENSEHVKKYQLEYRKENSCKIKEKEREYKQLNKDKISIYASVYNKNNSEVRKIKYKEWYLNNYDRVKINDHKRRNIEKTSFRTLTKEEWNAIKEHFDYKCAYCGSTEKITLDHFIPLSKGGELTINNVIPCCSKCNCRKHAKSYFDWYHLQPFYTNERNDKILSFLNYRNINGEHVQQLSLII